MVLGRPCSRTSFLSIFAKSWIFFAFSPALSGLCVRICMLMVENSMVKIGLIEEFKSYIMLVDYSFSFMLVGCDFEKNF